MILPRAALFAKGRYGIISTRQAPTKTRDFGAFLSMPVSMPKMPTSHALQDKRCMLSFWSRRHASSVDRRRLHTLTETTRLVARTEDQSRAVSPQESWYRGAGDKPSSHRPISTYNLCMPTRWNSPLTAEPTLSEVIREALDSLKFLTRRPFQAITISNIVDRGLGV